MGQRTCAVSDCDRPHRGRGYCNMHLLRLQRYGDVGGSDTMRHRGRVCTVAGCDRQADSHGMCGMHRHRIQTHGNAGAAESLRPGRGICSVDGCESPELAVRLCGGHYNQARKGKPFTPVRKSWRGKVMERDAEGNKQCRRCCEWRPETDFNKLATSKDGLGHYCRPCNRDMIIQRNYGITSATYDAMLKAQGGGCAICGTTDPGGRRHFAVDHDHACCPGTKTCGQCVRGLLCERCNHGLGHFKDDPVLLWTAMAYVERGTT